MSLALESREPTIPMERREGGFFQVSVDGIGAGALYRFALPDGDPSPDPASPLPAPGRSRGERDDRARRPQKRMISPFIR